MRTSLDETKPLNLQIIESLKPILSHNKHVHLNLKPLKVFAKQLEYDRLSENKKHYFPHSLLNEYIQHKDDRIDALGVFHSINFCYWSQKAEEKWTYFSTFHNTETDGAEALLLALIENYQKNHAFFCGSRLKALDQDTLHTALVNRNAIPLFEERLSILNAFGATLEKKYGNRFVNFITENSGYNASTIITNLLEDFPSFDDSVLYEGKRIWFLKRAQLLISHLSECGALCKSVRDELTAFADYKIPMVLNKYGILNYSNELQDKIRGRELIRKDSRMELEIRAFTIFAIEEIKRICNSKFNAAQIDSLLWQQSQKIKNSYHLTHTSAY